MAGAAGDGLGRAGGSLHQRRSERASGRKAGGHGRGWCKGSQGPGLDACVSVAVGCAYRSTCVICTA